MQGENLGTYLRSVGELAPWLPVGGGAGADVRVLFGVEGDPMFNGIVLGDRPAVLIATSDCAGMSRGDSLTVGGDAYTLRSVPKKLDDGAFSIVDLEVAS